DLLVVEDPPVVEVPGGRAARDLRGFQRPRLVHVRDRDHLGARQVLELPHEAAGPAPGADHPDPDAVVGAYGAGGGEAGPCEDAPPGRPGTRSGWEWAVRGGLSRVGRGTSPRMSGRW